MVFVDRHRNSRNSLLLIGKDDESQLVPDRKKIICGDRALTPEKRLKLPQSPLTKVGLHDPKWIRRKTMVGRRETLKYVFPFLRSWIPFLQRSGNHSAVIPCIIREITHGHFDREDCEIRQPCTVNLGDTRNSIVLFLDHYICVQADWESMYRAA